MHCPEEFRRQREHSSHNPFSTLKGSNKTQDAKKNNQLAMKKAKWYEPGGATALPSPSVAKIRDHEQETKALQRME